MRRRWGLASFLAVLLVSLTASAQEADVTAAVASPDEGVAPSQAIAYGAMPGGLHAPTAETLPKGAVEVSTLVGLGRRTGLLGPDHKFNRGDRRHRVRFGVDRHDLDRALARRPLRSSLGHAGDPAMNSMTTTPTKTADGRRRLRRRSAPATCASRRTPARCIVGGQLGIWVPGKDAPSIAGSAISVDARALVSLPAGPGLLSFSGGFRLDNSAEERRRSAEALAPGSRLARRLATTTPRSAARSCASPPARRGSRSKARSMRSSAGRPMPDDGRGRACGARARQADLPRRRHRRLSHHRHDLRRRLPRGGEGARASTTRRSTTTTSRSFRTSRSSPVASACRRASAARRQSRRRSSRRTATSTTRRTAPRSRSPLLVEVTGTVIDTAASRSSARRSR